MENNPRFYRSFEKVHTVGSITNNFGIFMIAEFVIYRIVILNNFDAQKMSNSVARNVILNNCAVVNKLIYFQHEPQQPRKSISNN